MPNPAFDYYAQELERKIILRLAEVKDVDISTAMDWYYRSQLAVQISQNINDIASGYASGLIFVPHLTPMIRGMHATIYVHTQNDVSLHDILAKHYSGSLFVDVLPEGVCPETRSVRASNQCRISVQKVPQQENMWIILSVIDNLVKGAAGQAVQNMNLMFGFEEDTGLAITPVLP